MVRFQGGPNAGHSIHIGDQSIVLHQVPSGILRKGCRAISGPGMVISPADLVSELAQVRNANLLNGEFLVSERAHVILPLHRAADAWEERQRGASPAGTTMRGIGPSYMDRVGRWGIRMGDLLRPDTLKEKIDRLYRARSYVKGDKAHAIPTPEETLEELRSATDVLRSYIGPTEGILNRALASNERILLEGAQGALLDVDFGTYPYTTSSHTTTAGAFVGAGLPPRTPDAAIGITKAYSTRVGNGPFPTELADEVGERIREKGGERGATTGRPRRCGWLDLVLLRYAHQINGFTGFAITKVDVLGGEDRVRVATAYRDTRTSETVKEPPTFPEDYEHLEPVYEDFPGWKEFTPALHHRIKAEGYSALPPEARRYLSFVSKELGVPTLLVSYGPGREEVVRPGAKVGLRPWPAAWSE